MRILFRKDNKMKEVWNKIPNFSNYLVSNFGRIKSIDHYDNYRGRFHKGKIKKLFKKRHYAEVMLHKEDKIKNYSCRVHRLVLEAFVSFCPDGMECCHNNGNGKDNRLENLRWDTKLSNNRDKIKHKTQPMGETHSSSKLKQEQVLKIREEYVPYSKKYNIYSLSNKYNVDPVTIHNIISFSSWKHLKGERYEDTSVDA
jgi:NUMOD4 motif-containing protein/HNH endonuclease